MTADEAKREVNKAFEPAFANYIIEALTNGATCSDKRESSTDAVSRKEALKEMQRYHDDCAKTSEYTRLGFETAMNVVRDLPPVTPQPKTGHWIDDKCSVCGKGTEALISSREWYRNEEPKFCPFCGIKLVESQVGDEE